MNMMFRIVDNDHFLVCFTKIVKKLIYGITFDGFKIFNNFFR